MDDAEAIKQINGRMTPRDTKVVRAGPHFTIRRYLSEIGKRGAQARAPTPPRRKRSGWQSMTLARGQRRTGVVVVFGRKRFYGFSEGSRDVFFNGKHVGTELGPG